MPDEAATLGSLLAETKAAFEPIDVDDPGLEARLIVEQYSGTTRTDALLRPDTPVSIDATSAIRSAVSRRLLGEPIHRIFGEREFFGLVFRLSEATLEPRQDTETLVEAVLPFMRARVAERGACSILDLGTGTGAIVVSLLHAVPEGRGVATDVSRRAVETAEENARRHGVHDRLSFVVSDWFDNVSGRFDAIISNPPYIPSAEVQLLDREVRDFDPIAALDGGIDGLLPYRMIATRAASFLKPGGLVAVEFGSTQRSDVKGIFESSGYRVCGEHRDLAGRDRVLAFTWESDIVQCSK